MNKKILVIGATGNVGKYIVEGLIAKGESVKAASRSGKTNGAAEGVVFDFHDPASVENAFSGVDRAYVMVPTGYIDVVSLVTPVLDVAIRHGVKVVFQSVLGVDADDNIPYRQLELKLMHSGVPHVILRPNWFSDNFHTFWQAGLKQGVIAVPAADGHSSFIDVRDIADAAVSALTSDAFNGQDFNLTGPQAISYAEAAQLLSDALGIPVQYQAVSDDIFVENLVNAGVDAAYARFLASIFYPVREGWTAQVTNAVELLTGHPARTLQQYIADNHAALSRA